MFRPARVLRTAAAKLGVDISRGGYPPDFDEETVAIDRRVRAQTMTSPARVAALVGAVRYVDRYGIPGAIVECGVWRGGSSMAAALAHKAQERDLYLYDTFEGMVEPTAADVSFAGVSAADAMTRNAEVRCVAGMNVVRANMAGTGYPADRVHFVPGKVEDTIPETVPGQIAILRLDTDWYESTRHELEHLAPLLAPGGVLILDDYGHWHGARKAVDEWVDAYRKPVLLTRVDYSGRVVVLP